MASALPLRRVRCASSVVALACLAGPACAQPSPGAPLETGGVIPRVVCAAAPEQSYALYLPPTYHPGKPWPIIYAFDPGAQGRHPVEQMKAQAEKYGYILAGSNNSRNGPRQPQLEAAEAVLNDTASRLSLDRNRMYFTGFSGGGRVSGMVAFLCQGCAAGVIAHGAGLPLDSRAEQVSFGVFVTAGDTDFNLEEVSRLAERLEELGKPNRLRVFAGPHDWPPAEVWAEAFAWIELIAMKEGRRPKDPAFIAAQFARGWERAAAGEATAPHAAYEEYRRLAREFEGLADASAFARKAAELKDSPAVREGRRQQDEEFRRTKEMWEELGRRVVAVRQNTEGRAALLGELRGHVDALDAEATQTRDAPKARAIRRALASAFAFAIEQGGEHWERKDYFMALVHFEAAAEIYPRSPGPAYQIARAYARLGDRRNALRALRNAADRGMTDTALLREAPEFAPWRARPDFQKILARVEANAARRPAP